MLKTLFENFALQLIFFVGIISLLGLIIWRLNKILFKQLGYKYGKKVFLSTGIIGVPIHEFGHAFFCVLFFHKIKEIKWFTPNTHDGTLGYVRHSYNKNNIYQQIGNFFIGIGPLLFGSAIIILLMYLLLPNSNAVAEASKITFGTGDGISLGVTQYFEILYEVFLAIFNHSNFTKIAWWVFIILACSVAMHMNLSLADVKGMLRGLMYIVILLFLINLILCLIKVSLAQSVTSACLWLSITVVSFMATAVLLLIVLAVISITVRLFKRKVKA